MPRKTPIVKFTPITGKNQVQVRINGRLRAVLVKKKPGFPNFGDDKPYWNGSMTYAASYMLMGGSIMESSLIAAKEAVRKFVKKNARAFA